MIDAQLTPVPASIYCVLITEEGLDIRLDVLATDNVVVLAGAGQGGSMDWDASVPDAYDPIGIINTIWST